MELGGLDVLTFSGGIGENSTEVRAAVCADLGGFGIELDAARNAALTGEGRISREGGSRPPYWSCLPTKRPSLREQWAQFLGL